MSFRSEVRHFVMMIYSTLKMHLKGDLYITKMSKNDALFCAVISNLNASCKTLFKNTGYWIQSDQTGAEGGGRATCTCRRTLGVGPEWWWGQSLERWRGGALN